MKKFLLVLLIAIMALSFAGCTQENGTADEPSEGEDVYNVVNLVNGNLGDKSFFDSAESGLRDLEEAGRITYKTIEMKWYRSGSTKVA